MKKALFLLVLISVFENAAAQTLLNRFPLELHKSGDYYQIFNAQNQQNEYFAFIADKEKITVLKYNSALFFKDSLSVARPEKALDFMAGVTFTADGDPDLYWSSSNYETIKMIHFDFKKRETSDLVYENNFSRKKIIDTFVANNTFNIVSITPENTLKFTVFSNSGRSENILSLNSEPSSNSKPDADIFVNAILEKGLTIVEERQFNPLFNGVAKVKRYLRENFYILTFDTERATTLFRVDLNNFSSQKDDFPYEAVTKNSGSNSFLNRNILYQISINETSISLYGFDLNTKNLIGKHQATSNQEIEFKNSPLFLQAQNNRTRELKNTAKFLEKMDFKNLGLTVYSTPNYDLFTIGSEKQVASGGSIALGLGLVIGGAIGGAVVDADDLITYDNRQNIYFESYFDANFQHLKVPFQPLYIDDLGAFSAANRTSVQNIFAYQDYIILNYYDSKSKEFVMRKFEDTAY